MKRIYLTRYSLPRTTVMRLKDIEGVENTGLRFCVIDEKAFDNKEVHILLGEKILVVEGKSLEDITERINAIK